MSNNKQSSVEWFLDQLIEHRIIIVDKTTYQVKYKHEILLEQAKAMHGNEVRDAFYIGRYEYNNFDSNSKQYYNETFGGNNEQQ